MGEFAAVTTRGRRPANEDALAVAGTLLTGEVTEPVHGRFVPGPNAAFVVSDGVGGRAHGARASREVALEFTASARGLAAPESCAEAVRQANLRLNGVMLQNPHTEGMAATLAGVSVLAGSVCWFNVGDSRVYHSGVAGLRQLSVDDTVDGASETGRASHMLLRSLGGDRMVRPVQAHVGENPLVRGDRLLLCTDGLWDMLPDHCIADILAREKQAVSAVRCLLVAALDSGGRDNISIVLIQ